jgi:O-antigen ligase
LLVIVIAWTTAAQGGTRAVDLAGVVVLLLAALCASAERPGRLRPSPHLFAVLVLEVWLLAAGTRGAPAVGLAALRVPVLVLIVVLAVHVALRLDGRQRAVVIDGLVVVGTIQACIAVGQVVLTWWSTGSLTLPTRAAALLGNANVLGIVLVATGTLTLRSMARSPTRVLSSSLVVQGIGLLLTGSRLALMTGALVLLCCCRMTRDRRIAGALVAWLAVAAAVVGARFAVAGDDRLHLWAAALRQIALHPLFGRGVAPMVIEVPASVIGPTTHAHNEVIQFVLEYGLVGLVLAVIPLVLAVRRLREPPAPDWFLVAAGAAVLACGITDVGLRVTAVAVMAGLIVTMAWTRPDGADLPAAGTSPAPEPPITCPQTRSSSQAVRGEARRMGESSRCSSRSAGSS